jgi:putative membrane protein
MMYPWSDHMNGWGWTVMSISSLLFLGLVIAGIIAAVRSAKAGADDRPLTGPALTPRSLLADRFARGEIDEAEYRRRVDVLNQTAGNGPNGAP